MSTRRKGSPAPLVLAALAVVLMLGPRALPGAARATLTLAVVPLRATALGASHLFSRAAPAATAEELARERDYYLRKAQELHRLYTEARERCRELAGTREVLPDPRFKLLPASVIVNADGSAWRRTIAIARGSSDGVRAGQLVLWEKHLVGRVAETGPWSSRVQLLCDPAFKTGAVCVPRLQGTGASLSARETGVFEGSGDRCAVLKWLSGETTTEEGALVVTTADPDKGVPAGLILGRVAGVSRGCGPNPRVEVQPFINPSALESVTVVLGVEP